MLLVLVTHLVQGILGYHIEAAQVSVSVHEHDSNRPEGDDGENANEWVDPNGCASDFQLKEKQGNISNFMTCSFKTILSQEPICRLKCSY